MGLFDKIFGKKTKTDESHQAPENGQLEKGTTFISTGNNAGHKVVRPLTEKQKEAIGKSTILAKSELLFMHYWTDNLVCTDRDDQEWQNKVMFFWKAEEPFPKKSLPPYFETFKKKHFYLCGDHKSLTFRIGIAAPWFVMPGGGEKYACFYMENEISIPELHQMGFVEYVEHVELADYNFDILTNTEEYFFLVDERITPYKDGYLFLNGQPVPYEVAYMIGGIHIVKRVGLE